MVKITNSLSISCVALFGALAFSVQATEVDTNTARLQAMNKLTGRVTEIDVPVNGENQFGSFSIVVRACKTRPPEETPDNFAFVDVVDKKEDGSSSNIFKGWMVSSSPALHAIEHPIYDVWLLQCLDTQVDSSKLLTPEQLAARDEIVPVVQDITESSLSNASPSVPARGEPESLLPQETLSPSSALDNTEEVILQNTSSGSFENEPQAVSTVYETNESYSENLSTENSVPQDTQVSGPQNLILPVDNASSIEKAVPLSSENEINDTVDVFSSEVSSVSVEPAEASVKNIVINEDKVLQDNIVSESAFSSEPQQLISFDDVSEDEIPVFLQ